MVNRTSNNVKVLRQEVFLSQNTTFGSCIFYLAFLKNVELKIMLALEQRFSQGFILQMYQLVGTVLCFEF